jgi:hypothetical protein
MGRQKGPDTIDHPPAVHRIGIHTGNGKFEHSSPCLLKKNKKQDLKQYSESGFEFRILYQIIFLASEATPDFHDGNAPRDSHLPMPLYLATTLVRPELLVRSSSHLPHKYASPKTIARDKTDVFV